MAVAGAAAGAGSFGVFGLLREIVDEAGDITQAVLEQLNAIKVVDHRVVKTKYHRYHGKLTSKKETTTTYTVTLFEVLFIGLAAGVITLLRDKDGKLGISFGDWWRAGGGLAALPLVGPIVVAATGGLPDIPTGVHAPGWLPRDIFDPSEAQQTKPYLPGKSKIPEEWIS